MNKADSLAVSLKKTALLDGAAYVAGKTQLMSEADAAWPRLLTDVVRRPDAGHEVRLLAAVLLDESRNPAAWQEARAWEKSLKVDDESLSKLDELPTRGSGAIDWGQLYSLAKVPQQDYWTLPAGFVAERVWKSGAFPAYRKPLLASLICQILPQARFVVTGERSPEPILVWLPLSMLLQHPHEDVRRAAANGLATVRAPEAVPALLSVVETQPPYDASFRGAVDALCVSLSSESRKLLGARLQTSDRQYLRLLYDILEERIPPPPAPKIVWRPRPEALAEWKEAAGDSALTFMEWMRLEGAKGRHTEEMLERVPSDGERSPKGR